MKKLRIASLLISFVVLALLLLSGVAAADAAGKKGETKQPQAHAAKAAKANKPPKPVAKPKHTPSATPAHVAAAPKPGKLPQVHPNAAGNTSAKPSAHKPKEELAPIVHGLAVLRAVEVRLRKADHDYGGHRHKAVNDVNRAENQLKLVLGAAPAGSWEGVGGENQHLSNLQLAHAVTKLEATRHHLANAKSNYGGHRDHAVRDLGHAISELHQALRFEKGTALVNR